MGTILIGLFGGLALFLYGMDQMTEALKIVAGNRMKNILATLTTNRFMGVFVGTTVTAIIQSSSVTTVMVVGFISAGLMTLQQSVGVMLGADIGTTITAQIVAFKVTKYALVLIAIGFLMLFTARRQRVRQYGVMVMGLGMIFFGMSMMSDATKPLRTYQPFIDMMQQMETPLYGILVGAIFTSVAQTAVSAQDESVDGSAVNQFYIEYRTNRTGILVPYEPDDGDEDHRPIAEMADDAHRPSPAPRSANM